MLLLWRPPISNPHPKTHTRIHRPLSVLIFSSRLITIRKTPRAELTAHHWLHIFSNPQFLSIQLSELSINEQVCVYREVLHPTSQSFAILGYKALVHTCSTMKKRKTFTNQRKSCTNCFSQTSPICVAKPIQSSFNQPLQTGAY